MLLQTKDTVKALDVLNQGAAVFPDSLTLNIDRINIYISQGRQPEAIDIMNKAIQQDPRNSALYAVLGDAYGASKNNEKAIEFYKKAIEINPSAADAYNNIGKIYLDSANQVIEQLAAPNIPDPLYNKLTAQKDAFHKKALPYLEKAAELKPNSLLILEALRVIYAKMGNDEKVAETKKKMDALKKK